MGEEKKQCVGCVEVNQIRSWTSWKNLEPKESRLQYNNTNRFFTKKEQFIELKLKE